MSASDTTPAMRREFAHGERGGARRVAAGLVLLAAVGALFGAAPAAAQPDLYAVSRDVVYLPGEGVALDAATGRLRWRVPRLAPGRVLTDGAGVLVYAYLADVYRVPHFRRYRVCRVATETGKTLWCFATVHLDHAALSARGDLLFLLRGRRLDFISVATGRRVGGLDVPNWAGARLFALADDSAALFLAGPAGSSVLVASVAGEEDAAAGRADPPPRARAWRFPRALYAFHGPGPGVLWYAPARARFVVAAPPDAEIGGALAAAYERLPRPLGFPRVVTGRAGYVVEMRRGAGWLLSGGGYRHAPWSRARADFARVLLAGRFALLLGRPAADQANAPAAVTTPVAALRVENGEPLFDRNLRGRWDDALVAGGGGEGGAAALFGPGQIVMLGGDGGALWWRDYRDYEPAALTAPAVLAWNRGELVGLDRNSGDLLWRVRFRLAAK